MSPVMTIAQYGVLLIIVCQNSWMNQLRDCRIIDLSIHSAPEKQKASDMLTISKDF